MRKMRIKRKPDPRKYPFPCDYEAFIIQEKGLFWGWNNLDAVGGYWFGTKYYYDFKEAYNAICNFNGGTAYYDTKIY